METDSIVDYSLKIIKILKNYDIYVIEYKLREFDKEVTAFCLNEEAFDSLKTYVRTYINFNHILETDFQSFIFNLLKKVSKTPITPYLKLICLVDLTYEDIFIEELQRSLGYNKIYTTFKDVMNDIFKENYDYEYLSLFIRLLENEKLVYKNLKPLLSRLVKYVTNNLVEKNITNCCKIISAVTLQLPNLLNEKITVSIISFLVEILFTPKNYLFLSQENDSKDIVIAINLLLTNYNSNDKGFDRKKYIMGLLRQVVGKIELYKNSMVQEEIQVVVNLSRIVAYVFQLYIELECNDFSFLKNLEEIFSPSFITQHYSGIDKKGKIDLNREDEMYPCNLRYLTDLFLEEKYKFFDFCEPFISFFNREIFLLELKTISRPVSVLKHIDNLTDSIDWSDLIILMNSGDTEYRLNFFRFLFHDNFIKSKGHFTYLEIILKDINSSEAVLFAKLACEKSLDAILVKLYFKTLAFNDGPGYKTRELILNYILENRVNIPIDCLEIKELRKESEYLNLLLLLITITIKTKPVDLKNIDNHSKIVEDNISSERISDDSKNTSDTNRVVDSERTFSHDNIDSVPNTLSDTKIHSIISTPSDNRTSSDSDIGNDELKELSVFIRKFLKKNNPYNNYYSALIVYILSENTDSLKINNYYDIILALFYQKVTGKLLSDKIKSDSFPILLDLTTNQLQEIKQLTEKKSDYLNKYNNLLFLLGHEISIDQDNPIVPPSNTSVVLFEQEK